MNERSEIVIPLSEGSPIKIRYAKQSVSPDTYYDHVHSHVFLEICMVITGKMFHFANGHTYRLNYGDIFFCRSNELHYALAAEDSVYERLAVWIPENAFDWLAGGNKALLGVFLDSEYFDTNVFTLNDECKDTFGKLLGAVTEEVKHPTSEYGLHAAAKLADLLCFVNRNVENSVIRSDGNGETPRMIWDVVKYVRENYRNIRNAESAAESLYVNKDYLNRIFKKYIGITVHDYLMNIRIGKSKLLLKEGRSVTDVAMECGFNSASYFIKLFKKATGTTPSKYGKKGAVIVDNRE